ncbi:MAG: ATP-dependent zinc metalloprotease FtsH [Flavobacteriales bacterium]|nr:ATP-dependent zinc metalloprotease FtsH [Flavobacteriales bacterium]
MKPKGERPKKSFNFYWIYGIIIVLILSIQLFQFGGRMEKITPTEYKSMAERGHVQRIVIVNEQVVKVYIKEDSLKVEPHKSKLKGGGLTGDQTAGPQYAFNQGNSDVEKNDLVIDARKYGIPYEYETQSNWGESVYYIVLFGAMILIWVVVMRRLGGGGGPGGQIFNIGKSRAQVFEGGKTTNVTFNDVAGLAEAKEELQEIVDFLKNPKRYTDLGAKIPKGALLVGPPGTGKTLLAKAIAGEANVPFFSLSGSDFVEMFVGVGASRVRDLFKQAKEKAPSIIFIDEIDAIGRARGRSVSMGANDERENTLNQLLTELDGFGTNSGVILIGATNRADVLDRALLRPGRFDRQIFVDMPDLNEREEILKVHLKPLKLDKTVDVSFLARQTPGFSGADLANICNEAALIAARKKKQQVDKQDFLDAVDRVIGGLEKKNRIITTEEKKAIAYHEAGHATVSWLVEHASPLVKVTIVPRGRSLGAAWYLPDERHLTTAEQMLDEMCAALGGRAAEDVMYGKVSTGALSDLEKVTKQAYAMVTVYGLNTRVGNISYYDSSGQSEYSFGKPYSERTAQTIDEEVSKIVEGQYVRAKRILSENKDKLTALATQLLDKEVIFKEDLEKIFGDRPFVKPEPAASNGSGGAHKAAPEAPPAPVPAPSEPSEGLFGTNA